MNKYIVLVPAGVSDAGETLYVARECLTVDTVSALVARLSDDFVDALPDETLVYEVGTKGTAEEFL